jgi:hypothetical protein
MAREYGDAELTRLQIPDINRRRMVIHIRGGKGRQDRDVMLSPRSDCGAFHVCTPKVLPGNLQGEGYNHVDL